MINDKIKTYIEEQEQELIETRRKLHSEPELSWEEEQTTAYICAELDKIGIPYKKTKPTGVIAELKGSKPGKTVALRGDMDALPIQQLNKDVPYASKTDGIMHACGHDAHTSMLLFAAKALYQVKDELAGSVRFLFQPAEEIAEGAKVLIEQGAMEGVDNVFGIHVWSPLETNKIVCSPGPSFAAVDTVRIEFTGRGGHGAIPHDAIDAAVIASSFVMNVQTVVARTLNPLDPAVVTIGKMDVGTGYNVIAENAFLEGTVRTFSNEARDHIEKTIKHYADQVATTYGGTAKITYIRGADAVINEEHSAHLVQKVATSAFGEDVVHQLEPTMGGEDFSLYLNEAPGSFALVGSGNAKKDTQWAHHHGKFDIDEDALKTGAELYAQYAWAYLNE